MRVAITQHSEPLGPVRWWYWNKIGQEFEVWEDPDREIYYYTNHNGPDGIERAHHILKVDCEVNPNGT